MLAIERTPFLCNKPHAGTSVRGVEKMFLVKCSSCHWPVIRKSGKGDLGELDVRDLALR